MKINLPQQPPVGRFIDHKGLPRQSYEGLHGIIGIWIVCTSFGLSITSRSVAKPTRVTVLVRWGRGTSFNGFFCEHDGHASRRTRRRKQTNGYEIRARFIGKETLRHSLD